MHGFEGFEDGVVACGLGVFVVPDFGCYVERGAREGGGPDGFLRLTLSVLVGRCMEDTSHSHLRLVFVELGGVYLPVTLFEGGETRFEACRAGIDAQS